MSPSSASTVTVGPGAVGGIGVDGGADGEVAEPVGAGQREAVHAVAADLLHHTTSSTRWAYQKSWLAAAVRATATITWAASRRAITDRMSLPDHQLDAAVTQGGRGGDGLRRRRVDDPPRDQRAVRRPARGLPGRLLEVGEERHHRQQARSGDDRELLVGEHVHGDGPHSSWVSDAPGNPEEPERGRAQGRRADVLGRVGGIGQLVAGPVRCGVRRAGGVACGPRSSSRAAPPNAVMSSQWS